MDFALLPPEVNSGRMYTGAGAGPMLAAAAGWDELFAELESAAAGYASVVSDLAGEHWSGPAAAAMASAALLYARWLQTTAAQAEQTAMQAKTAAAAFEAAFAATVPPTMVAANRALLATLVATNFFGQNTAAIMAAEAQYAEMWAQDAAAMYGYAEAASSSTSTLTPFREPPPTTSPAGLAAQAGEVAHAALAAHAAGAHAAGAHAAGAHALSAASPATELNPLGSTASASNLLSFLGTPAGGLTVQGLSYVELVPDYGLNIPLSYTTAFYTIGTNGFGYFREFLVRGGIAGYTTFTGLGPINALFGSAGANALGGLGKAALLGPFAALGQASSVGAVSVPPTWATAAAGSEPVAISLAAVNTGAAPAAAVGLPPGMAMQEAMMGTMSGRGALSGATDRRRGNGDDRGDKDGKAGERSAAALIAPSGWLASTWAYSNRRRPEPDPLPLPPQWQEELAASQSAWG